MTNIPTLQELYNGVISDLESEFGVSINPFGKAMLRALAGVQAGILKIQYLRIGKLQKNIWVDTADPVAVGGTLERFGFTKLQRLPYPATQGQYVLDVTGTAGATIPALTQFKSNDSSLNPGFLYILDTAFVLPTGTDQITVRALTAGTASLLAISDTLTATAPIINVDSIATVSSISVDPVEAETTDEYRNKAIQAYQLSPQGGAPADYRLWGLDAAGTRQIYPYTNIIEIGEVDVFVEAILADSVGPPYQGVPTPTILTDVENDIETDPVTGIGRRPLGVLAVNVAAIIPNDIDITIDSGGTITVGQQALITQALTEAIYNIRPFIAGIDNTATRNDVISQYGVGNVILQTIGSVIISSIVLEVNGSPETSFLFDLGNIPYLNSVTYI